MDPNRLLEQFLALQGGSKDVKRDSSGRTPALVDRISSSGWKGIAGGIAAGGLLGLLVGNKKARKTIGRLAGGAVGYGGAAALGALAYRAYQNWSADPKSPQESSNFGPSTNTTSSAPASTGSALSSDPPEFLPAAKPASDGRPFELALIKAMIAAANADGHIGPDEQQRIFSHLASLPLDSEDKAFVFDALKDPPNAGDVAILAKGVEQASEIYLVSLLALDASEPEDRAYLDDLARRLTLPASLIAQLENEVSRSEPVAA